MKQKLSALFWKILPWLVQATGVQIQNRLDPNLRAMLFGASILSIGTALYLGWIDATVAGLLWTNVIALFNWDIVKKAAGDKTGTSLQQVTTVVQIPVVEAVNKANGEKSVMQDRISVNVPISEAPHASAVVAGAILDAQANHVAPLSDEFTKESP